MADAGGPSRSRARLGAFHGGPLGVGWAPWAIGAGALALGIFFFMRRGSAAQPQAQAAGGPGGALPIAQPYPYPTGVNPPGPQSNPSAQQLTQQLKGIWTRPQGQIRAAPSADPASTVIGSPPLGTILPLGAGVPDPGGTQGQWYAVTGGNYSGGWAWSGDITLLPQQSNLSSQQLSSMGGFVNQAA